MGFRKRPPTNDADHEAISAQLRAAMADIGAKNFAAALSKLDALSAQASLPADRQCQIAAMAGQALLAQGKFAQAATTFQQAWQLGADTAVVWFNAALGQVLAQLRNVDVETAVTTGKAAVTTAEQKVQQYGGQVAAAPQLLGQTGVLRMDRAPIRASVVAFRIGQQFWNEGEAEQAAWFFTKATEIEPQGACRARIALARIALVNEDFQGAYDQARQALVLGQFHAKTLSAWPVLIAASRKLGNSGVEQALVNSLAQATPTVRGRARLSIAATLRSYGDPAWTSFATVQTGEDRNHILQAEFGKLKTARTSALAPAEALLATPNLSPLEWLGAAKAAVVRRLARGANPALGPALAAGVTLYGEPARKRLQHGLALACARGKRPDLAISILQGASEPKSVWLQAKLLRDSGSVTAAAALFNSLSTRGDVPPRFQLLASMEWMRCVIQTGDENAITNAAPQLIAAAKQIQDYELLLDLARQMTLAPSPVADHAEEVFDKGQRQALLLFASAEEPACALEILFKLARRQNDFGKYADIAQIWEQLPQARRDWLWSRDGLFWQYLGLVAAAYRASDQLPKADTLVEQYLNDGATPPGGLAEIGVPHALSLVGRNDLASAFEWFEWLVWQAPTSAVCAYAYYWLALRAEKAGDVAQVQSRVQALALALGSSPGMMWKQALDAKGRLLGGSTVAQIAAQSTYTEDYLQQQLGELQEDRGRLS